MFLGLESLDFCGDGNGITARFRFVDGSEDVVDFFEEPFQLPWGSDQPNDRDLDDDCVM